MTTLGLILGGAALVGVGVGIGARAAERALPRVLAYLLRTEIRLARAERQVGKLARQLEGAEEAFRALADSFDQTVKTAARIAYDNGVEEGQAFEAQRREAGLS